MMAHNPNRAASSEWPKHVTRAREILASPVVLPLVLAGTAMGLATLIFHGLGNASHIASEGRSVFSWISRQWTLSGGDFSHGWLMPFISLYVLYTKRDAIAQATRGVGWLGLALVIASCLLHVAAYRAQQPRLSLVAYCGLLFSLPWFICGWQTARHLLFPVGYLLLAVVSYYLIALTFPLRLVSSAISVTLLNGIGIGAVRRGTVIYSAAAGGFVFDVADPCSGLRSVVVLTALAAPFAYFTQSGLVRRCVLFALSVPLAVLSNSLRIVTIGIVAEVWGMALAKRIWHDFSGYLLFIIAALLLTAVGALLKLDYKGRIKSWIGKPSQPSA